MCLSLFWISSFSIFSSYIHVTACLIISKFYSCIVFNNVSIPDLHDPLICFILESWDVVRPLIYTYSFWWTCKVLWWSLLVQYYMLRTTPLPSLIQPIHPETSCFSSYINCEISYLIFYLWHNGYSVACCYTSEHLNFCIFLFKVYIQLEHIKI